jgi:hypothetical protein
VVVYAVVALAVYAAMIQAAAMANRADRPVVQALARMATLLPAYLHELAHAGVSILFTGRGRIRLHSVHESSQRPDGQVALGSSDVYYRGPLTNWLISAAPALLLWPLAVWLAFSGDAGLAEAAGVGLLAYAGRLSDSDREHLRRPGASSTEGRPAGDPPA